MIPAAKRLDNPPLERTGVSIICEGWRTSRRPLNGQYVMRHEVWTDSVTRHEGARKASNGRVVLDYETRPRRGRDWGELLVAAVIAPLVAYAMYLAYLAVTSPPRLHW